MKRMSDAMALTVDIEPTNRCNAKCYFCPRDATPHQGLMTPAVFEQALGRVVELRSRFTELGRPSPRVSLCGLGEPLLNRTEGVVEVAPEAEGEEPATSGHLLEDRAHLDEAEWEFSVGVVRMGLEEEHAPEQPPLHVHVGPPPRVPEGVRAVKVVSTEDVQVPADTLVISLARVPVSPAEKEGPEGAELDL